MGYNIGRSCGVTLMSAKNSNLELQWAQGYQTWTAKHWKNIAWSDETGFLLRYADSRVRIQHQQQEFIVPH